MKGHIVKALPEHADLMAAALRAADQDELQAVWEGDAASGLRYCVESSLEAWAWLVDGQVACLWGIGCGPGTMLGNVGYPWLMSTDLVEKHKFSFLRYYLPYLDRMREMFPYLTNWCDGRYQASHKWLEWMGFHVGELEPFGAKGVLFRRFWMEA